MIEKINEHQENALRKKRLFRLFMVSAVGLVVLLFVVGLIVRGCEGKETKKPIETTEKEETTEEETTEEETTEETGTSEDRRLKEIALERQKYDEIKTKYIISFPGAEQKITVSAKDSGKMATVVEYLVSRDEGGKWERFVLFPGDSQEIKFLQGLTVELIVLQFDGFVLKGPDGVEITGGWEDKDDFKMGEDIFKIFFDFRLLPEEGDLP
jgi:hypothetical protein